MSEWSNCPKCGAAIENLCACSNPACEDFNGEIETATKDELALIRSLQHFYCDHIVDGVPTGDWHIERTPEQAARLLRTHVASEVAPLHAEIAAIEAGLSKEYQAGDKRSGDLIDDFTEFMEHHKRVEAENATLRTALGEIHIHAHCISKAGPLHTPTLSDAWSKFDQIGCMATAAIAATARSNLKLD